MFSRVSWGNGIVLTCKRESTTNSPLNARDMNDVDLLTLLSRIKMVSLFSIICHVLHEIHEKYVKKVIIITYMNDIIIMIRRGEPLGELVLLEMVGEYWPTRPSTCVLGKHMDPRS